MTIISFIAINFGAIYRTTKSSYRDSPNYVANERLVSTFKQYVKLNEIKIEVLYF